MNAINGKRAFLDPAEARLDREFLDTGHLVRPVEDMVALERLRAAVVEMTARHVGANTIDSPSDFLDSIHRRLDVSALNDLRLAVINGLNELPWAREAYFSTARCALEGIVGNELAMQRRINLSIQLPGDDSSVLPVHADVWSGDSPFEVVAWLPLVDCHGSKSMFLLPPKANAVAEKNMAKHRGRSTEDLFAEIEPNLIWTKVDYGQVLLFSQNLMHGNRVNQEPETRWSMNCRFKSLFSPYAGKRLGEFFEPITIRAATRLGMAYEFPAGFDA
jgi:sporadic carbohydrate cluster 2OG-Fe(II) oxygenase